MGLRDNPYRFVQWYCGPDTPCAEAELSYIFAWRFAKYAAEFGKLFGFARIFLPKIEIAKKIIRDSRLIHSGKIKQNY